MTAMLSSHLNPFLRKVVYLIVYLQTVQILRTRCAFRVADETATLVEQRLFRHSRHLEKEFASYLLRHHLNIKILYAKIYIYMGCLHQTTDNNEYYVLCTELKIVPTELRYVFYIVRELAIEKNYELLDVKLLLMFRSINS